MRAHVCLSLASQHLCQTGGLFSQGNFNGALLSIVACLSSASRQLINQWSCGNHTADNIIACVFFYQVVVFLLQLRQKEHLDREVSESFVLCFTCTQQKTIKSIGKRCVGMITSKHFAVICFQSIRFGVWRTEQSIVLIHLPSTMTFFSFSQKCFHTGYQ